MLEAQPAAAKAPHFAFALSPEAADRARQLAQEVADHGAVAASAAIGRWLEQGRPRSSDRRTPLDPRLATAMASLAARSLYEGDAADQRALVMSSWSATPREVWRGAERDVAYRLIRAEKLMALDAPDLIVRVELEGLAAAVKALDGPARAIGSAPEDDPGPVVELRHAMERHARYELSLGTHTEVFRALRTKKRFADEPHHELSPGEPLAPFAALDARAKIADDRERWILDRLRFWKLGPAAELAQVASELAAALATIDARGRAKATRSLDEDEAELLRGGDYVAAAQARLEEIANDARAAEREGLVVVSEMARDLAY